MDLEGKTFVVEYPLPEDGGFCAGFGRVCLGRDFFPFILIPDLVKPSISQSNNFTRYTVFLRSGWKQGATVSMSYQVLAQKQISSLNGTVGVFNPSQQLHQNVTAGVWSGVVLSVLEMVRHGMETGCNQIYVVVWTISDVHPHLGKWSNLTSIFQMFPNVTPLGNNPSWGLVADSSPAEGTRNKHPAPSGEVVVERQDSTSYFLGRKPKISTTADGRNPAPSETYKTL